MNTLSILIYLAGVTDTLKMLMGVALGLSLMTLTVVICYAGISKDSHGPGDDDWERFHKIQCDALTKYAFIPATLAVLVAVLPSSTTVYAIAASEMGEKALNTPTAGKAVAALNAWLDRQIASAAPKKQEKDDK